MTQEQEIKGILVHFFREGTNEDYLDALNSAIKEIQKVKNCSIPDVVGQSEQLPCDKCENGLIWSKDRLKAKSCDCGK